MHKSEAAARNKSAAAVSAPHLDRLLQKTDDKCWRRLQRIDVRNSAYQTQYSLPSAPRLAKMLSLSG